MKEFHLFLIAFVCVFYLEGNYLNKTMRNQENTVYNSALKEGFDLGVMCRGIFTAESCQLLYEQTK